MLKLTCDCLQARIKALQSQLEDTLRQLSDMRAILNRDKCEAGTQTDVVLPQLPATSSDDEDGIHMSASVRPRRKFSTWALISDGRREGIACLCLCVARAQEQRFETSHWPHG
jgi:hypothetical protein